MNKDLEVRLINKFIIKDKRKRYEDFITSKKNRNKFIKKLAHFKDFDFELLEAVNGNEHQFVLDKLTSLNVSYSNCYIISENKDLDAKVVETGAALDEIIGYGMGTVMVFGNVDFIYYEGEDSHNRYISKRL